MDNLLWRAAEGGGVIVKIIFWDRRAPRGDIKRADSKNLVIMPWSDGENWLLGQDSNLQPIGYKHPKISSGLGLSHHPSQNPGEGVGRFLRALAAEYELAL